MHKKEYSYKKDLSVVIAVAISILIITTIGFIIRDKESSLMFDIDLLLVLFSVMGQDRFKRIASHLDLENKHDYRFLVVSAILAISLQIIITVLGIILITKVTVFLILTAVSLLFFFVVAQTSLYKLWNKKLLSTLPGNAIVAVILISAIIKQFCI